MNVDAILDSYNEGLLDLDDLNLLLNPEVRKLWDTPTQPASPTPSPTATQA